MRSSHSPDIVSLNEMAHHELSAGICRVIVSASVSNLIIGQGKGGGQRW